MINIIKNTPLQFNKRLSKIYKCNIFLKREDLQIIRSFKIRGAYNKMTKLNEFDKNNGIVCASAGNHAQGVAYVCNKLNIPCDIFIPSNSPLQKIKKIKYFGDENCNINYFGNCFDECLAEAKNFTLKNQKTFIHPFDDLDVIEGQGNIYNEVKYIKPDIISTCIGGGGLAAGLCLNNKNKNIKIYGAEPEGCTSMLNSIKYNKNIKLDTINNFVDGANVAKVGNLNFDICKDNLSNVFEISNGEICEQIIEMYEYDGIILEPAGALSLASLKHIPNIENKNIVCILSGGNNDPSRYQEIIEKYLVYKNLRHYFVINFYQKPGELRKFVEKILDKHTDIIRFEYIKKTNKNSDTALIGIEVNKSEKINDFINRLNSNNIDFKKINYNDLLYSLLI